MNRVAAGIEKFLNDQISSGTLSEEKVESLQVAIQCIQAVYDLDSEAAVTDVPDLIALVNGGSPSSHPSAAALAAVEVSDEDRKEAEKLKNAGNEHLTCGRAPLAIDCYTKAITLDPRNAVFYCNRAAAFTKDGQFEAAVKDCDEATLIDPNYAKAYSRLGAAYSGLKKNKLAIDAYKRALELDPGNAAAKASLEALLRASSAPSSAAANSAPNLKLPAGMDINSLLSNPELMGMAQQMMKDGSLNKMMKDPAVQAMMRNMMGGQNQE